MYVNKLNEEKIFFFEGQIVAIFTSCVYTGVSAIWECVVYQKKKKTFNSHYYMDIQSKYAHKYNHFGGMCE